MIVRKEEYKVDEAAFLLDLPARTILALCDGGIIACSRLVSNGAMKQRKKRYISHCEIVRFNACRPAEKRSDLASRLADPDSEQGVLPFEVQPQPDAAQGDEPVSLSKLEWRMVVAAILGFASKSDPLKGVAEKIGPAGTAVITRGLRVRNYEDIAA